MITKMNNIFVFIYNLAYIHSSCIHSLSLVLLLPIFAAKSHSMSLFFSQTKAGQLAFEFASCESSTWK